MHLQKSDDRGNRINSFSLQVWNQPNAVVRSSQLPIQKYLCLFQVLLTLGKGCLKLIFYAFFEAIKCLVCCWLCCGDDFLFDDCDLAFVEHIQKVYVFIVGKSIFKLFVVRSLFIRLKVESNAFSRLKFFFHCLILNPKGLFLEIKEGKCDFVF